ncbi:MAG: phosphoribosylformylglycinamidine synthase [Bacteroidales bacterium]|nr:phosphoribosylformylglycinamidine synthase [Bacteroidales bacterium]
MIRFFSLDRKVYYAAGFRHEPEQHDLLKLKWLFQGANIILTPEIPGAFIGPRKEMITPWSTNAVEITQNMGIKGIERIEVFIRSSSGDAAYDPMLQATYNRLDQELFTTHKKADPVIFVDDIRAFNRSEGLALNEDEVAYLEHLSRKIERKLTDSEVFGFSQVNSEHCRHKIFNGKFIIDDQEMEESLFDWIKKTAKVNPNFIVSAYKDNVAFLQGPVVMQFAPVSQDKPDFFIMKEIETVLSLKAETHNFPTTVEPFNGAATGTGGEIRDRMAGGKASLPLAGTAVYMTSFPRLEPTRSWEKHTKPRKWLYQSPEEILIKASNGASDFGNKFGQPLICGSVFTFEHFTSSRKYGYDKVVMLAGGIGYGRKEDSIKDKPAKDDLIIVMGGDNYRIGMGGGAVSSVATGEYGNRIELNAVQRSNPEMQKRVANAIRALAESDNNPIVTIHDHGAGGHLNSLSELVEETGGIIEVSKLPIGDPTLSAKEIIGNESQERMGLVLREKDLALLRRIAGRERAPMYVVGKTTGDGRFTFVGNEGSSNPLDLELTDMFGSPPKTVLSDITLKEDFAEPSYDVNSLNKYISDVLQTEAVACKDWLTNKVDRSVTGKVGWQQTAGPLQLPLNNLGIAALDYSGEKGIATAIGHAPVSGLADAAAGSVLSVAEALTNIIWAPLPSKLKSVSLSANWMWPARNPGENARLYKAVKAAAEFAMDLGINIPTGKDSLSMTQKYKDDLVYSPGTVIISAAAEVSDLKKTVGPVLQQVPDTMLLYIGLSFDDFKPDGSIFALTLNAIGNCPPTVKDPAGFRKVFNIIQDFIREEKILAGHDVSSGGLITTLLEMTFATNHLGLEISLDEISEKDIVKILFSENPGIVIQVAETSDVPAILKQKGVAYSRIGHPALSRRLRIHQAGSVHDFNIDKLRDVWYKTSYLLDKKQSGEDKALERYQNYKKQPLHYHFSPLFKGKASGYGLQPGRQSMTGIKAAIIREKGVNGDREMAYSLFLAGFDVKDVHMTDLISGREKLNGIHLIVFTGGFSNSDVLGSAKGWAGAFLFNDTAKKVLEDYYSREDTLSLGICNGCQLMVELGLINTGPELKPVMAHNASGKFESAFINVDILPNHSVMLQSMAGSRLGIWVAHGEGRIVLPAEESSYHIPVKYSYDSYPGNPNGSAYDTAAICSADGRHLAMMPHLERAVMPWQWPFYPGDRKKDEVSPWIEAFVNAREWIRAKIFEK